MLNLYRGLLERANEMRYANHANPLEREAARGAVQQRIARPNPPIIAANVEGQNAVNDNVNVPPPDPENEYDENDARLDGLDPEEAGEQRYFEHGVDPAEADEQRQRQIPVPNEPARRPYHALARENAEALNAFLTRDLPVVTHQLQQTMELMDQLIQRQLNN
jgi:hypothetical protein